MDVDEEVISSNPDKEVACMTSACVFPQTHGFMKIILVNLFICDFGTPPITQSLPARLSGCSAS